MNDDVIACNNILLYVLLVTMMSILIIITIFTYFIYVLYYDAKKLIVVLVMFMNMEPKQICLENKT